MPCHDCDDIVPLITLLWGFKEIFQIFFSNLRSITFNMILLSIYIFFDQANTKMCAKNIRQQVNYYLCLVYLYFVPHLPTVNLMFLCDISYLNTYYYNNQRCDLTKVRNPEKWVAGPGSRFGREDNAP